MNLVVVIIVTGLWVGLIDVGLTRETFLFMEYVIFAIEKCIGWATNKSI